MNYLAEENFSKRQTSITNIGQEAKVLLGKVAKGIGQGPIYKQKLMADLDRIRDLAFKTDIEASICSQYRLRDLQEEQANT